MAIDGSGSDCHCVRRRRLQNWQQFPPLPPFFLSSSSDGPDRGGGGGGGGAAAVHVPQQQQQQGIGKRPIAVFSQSKHQNLEEDDDGTDIMEEEA